MEARAALSRPGATSLPSNQTPVKVDIASVTSVTGPLPASIPSGCLSYLIYIIVECDWIFWHGLLSSFARWLSLLKKIT
jgi:hypothetical protein